MRKVRCHLGLAVVVYLCVLATPLNAVYIPPNPPDVNGTITATPIDDPGGPHEGWYLYVVDFQWNLDGQGAGLSHWDMIFKSDLYCPIIGDDIAFDSPSGYSTDANYPTNPDPYAISWEGEFDETGDTSLDPDVLTPVIKYNDYSDNPGSVGYGTFSFYSNAIPVYGIYTDAIVAKAGTTADTYGDLTGDAPICTIPEPSTILLFGLGLFFLLRKRKKHKA